MMGNMYAHRHRPAGVPARPPAAGPSLEALSAGAQPSAEQMGTRVDLPEGIREKMESSFGADFSNVKLYESQTVADAGAQAVTRGVNIAFAPGKLDLTSTSGQALLGHELSHVVSQARGESTGRGFLKDAGLESQADRQGAMAAQGESVYAGPVSPVSSGTAAASAGPMQAKKKTEEEKKAELYEAVSEGSKNREVEYGRESHTDMLRHAGRKSLGFSRDGGAVMFGMHAMDFDTHMAGGYKERFGPMSMDTMRLGVLGMAGDNGQIPANPLDPYDSEMSDPRESYRNLISQRAAYLNRPHHPAQQDEEEEE